jgi:dihydropteroate synthase
MAEIVGILNLSTDSFSGSEPDPLAHAERMLRAGADWIDVGAEASNPGAQRLEAHEEIARLTPVVRALSKLGARISIDTHKAETMRAMIDLGATMINDITALGDPQAASVLRAAPHVHVVLMHARKKGPKAEKTHHARNETLMQDIVRFFAQRIADSGLERERLVLDPGMGFFLDASPEASVTVLHGIKALREAFSLPVYIGTSRKSFIGTLLGGRAPQDRAAGTLATELFALEQGAAYIRTHDPAALKDAWTIWERLTPARQK